MVGSKDECIKYLCDAPEKQYKVDEWHPKRSLTANSYYWVLLGKLSSALGTSNDELHEELLRRYSVPYVNKEGVIPRMTIGADMSIDNYEGHYSFIKTNGKWSAYYRIKGSSDMDSKEMSHLLDGLISECKEVDIETMPPHELARLRGYIGA